MYLSLQKKVFRMYYVQKCHNHLTHYMLTISAHKQNNYLWINREKYNFPESGKCSINIFKVINLSESGFGVFVVVDSLFLVCFLF